MTRVAKISACIISFNEEERIRDCLESLQGIADEIVVVDSNSTDRTVRIASEFTDRIVRQSFLGYVEQKNFAVGQATHDWILSLDCDERLSPELRASVLEVKPQLGSCDAYRMARRTFYVDRWMDHCWYPDMKVRLFRRDVARWGGVNPHDSVQVDTGRIESLRGDILHYSFPTVSAHLQTIDRFSEISAREIVERGKRVSVLSPITHGTGAFFRFYLIKRGFLDGFNGLVVSLLSGVETFVKYAKAVYLERARRDR